MPKYTITEEVTYEVEADTPEQAMESWLQEGEDGEGVTFVSVDERTLTDENGEEHYCD